jgi:hypothetical protein
MSPPFSAYSSFSPATMEIHPQAPRHPTRLRHLKQVSIFELCLPVLFRSFRPAIRTFDGASILAPFFKRRPVWVST